MVKQETTPDAPAHTPGTSKGEEKATEEGREGGRQDGDGAGSGRTARDSTSINPEDAAPIDPQMPDMPPA